MCKILGALAPNKRILILRTIYLHNVIKPLYLGAFSLAESTAGDMGAPIGGLPHFLSHYPVALSTASRLLRLALL